MSLELPGWVVDVFYFVGLPWPAIDEDELRGWANDIREFATDITELSRLSHDAVQGLKDSNQAGVVKTMAGHWDHHHAQMMAMREPMHVFASALDVVAEAVVVQKGVVIGQAIALAGEVAATQGEALFTLGIAEAEVPAEVALTKMAVKFALQELELKIIGYLINKSAKAISDHVSQTVSKMLMGSGQIVLEAITLKLDYEALQRVADTAKKHKNRVENASIRAHRRATARKIETSERGGRWQVVQVLEAALISIAEDIFKKIPGVLHQVLDDTEKDLVKTLAEARKADADLAGDTPGSDAAHTPRTTAGDGESRVPDPERRDINPPLKGNATRPGGTVSYGDLSPKAKQLARALDDGWIPIKPGEVSVNHLVELQKFSGVEHAVVQGPNGELALFRGTATTSRVPGELGVQGYDFIAHTHPEDRLPGPPDDLERYRGIGDSMTRDVNNKMTPHMEVVISRNGFVRYFDGDRLYDVPQGTYHERGPFNGRGYIVPSPEL